MDQIVHGLARERVVGKPRSEQIVAIDDRRIGRSEIRWRAERPIPCVAMTNDSAQGMNQEVALAYIKTRIRRREMRIAAQIMVGENVLEDRIGIVAAEPIAPVISISTELRLSGLRVDETGVGTYSNVAAADLRLHSASFRRDLAAAVAVGQINPIVQPPTAGH